MTRHETSTRDIVIQRAYEDPGSHDGYRVLVDRFWPRGRSKGTLKLDDWAKELAPDAALIKWFGHEPGRWDEFRRRYVDELKDSARVQKLEQLLVAAGVHRITLVYGARNETQNQAVVLQEVLSALDKARR